MIIPDGVTWLRIDGGINVNAYNYNSNTWSNSDYRTIVFTIDHEVGVNITEEFYDWFTANAVQVKAIPAGAYLFNTQIKFPASGDSLYQFNITDIPFQYKNSSCVLTDMVGMKHTVDGNGSNLVFVNSKNTSYTLYNSGNSSGTSGNWSNANYRNIVFTEDFAYSNDFYDWFMSNAVLSS